jgi:hypothetical protein
MPTTDVDAAITAFGFGPEGTGVLDAAALGDAISRRGIPIKTLLLDQTFIAGLGNIYVDEVLFRSHVHPATAARELTVAARETILGHVPQVLAEGIRQGGAKIIRNIAHPVDQFPAVHAPPRRAVLRLWHGYRENPGRKSRDLLLPHLPTRASLNRAGQSDQSGERRRTCQVRRRICGT